MEFKKDKIAIIFLILLLILGTYLRFNNYNEIGYHHDSLLTVVGAVAWFYPYPYFPGLIYMGPTLGNIIIGAGCMLSNEDFSAVSQISPKFSPNIPILLGKEVANAEPYCKIPIYSFALMFFLLLSLLAIFLFKNYIALFPIAFFTFSQFILVYSRIIKVDIISYVFIFAALIFLWKAYETEKGLKKENIFFILCFIFLALAGATKFSAGIYMAFAFLLYIGKYWQETKLLIKKTFKSLKLDIANKINIPEETNSKSFILKAIIYFLIYIFIILLPYKLNPKNLYNIYIGYKRMAPTFSALNITTYIFGILHKFLVEINTLDLLILIFSIFIFIKLIFKKHKQKNEKFILYFVFLFIFTSIFFVSTSLFRVAVPLLISIILLMTLAFSNKSYSIFSILKIPMEKRRKIFFIFLTIYILYSILITIPHAPYYSRSNEIICAFEKEKCNQMVEENLVGLAIKQTVKFLDTIMQDNETFLYFEGAVPYVYSRYLDPWIHYQMFDMNFNKQVGRKPTLLEQMEYFNPENRSLRYYVEARWFSRGNKEINKLKDEHKPNYIITLRNKNVVRIYDLYNLTKKNF